MSRARAPDYRGFTRQEKRWALRKAPGVYDLRSRRSANAIKLAIFGGADRFGVRVVQLSVQGNHIHLLVEAPDQLALGRAMKGLGVRIARRMNAMMGRTGRVIGDRYHARRLQTPTEVRTVMHYIRHNHQHHGYGRATVDEFSSDVEFAGVVAPARLWLVTTGWRRGRVRHAEDPLLAIDGVRGDPRFARGL